MTRYRSVAVLRLFAAFICLVVQCGCASESSGARRAERQVFDNVNRERKRAGLEALHWNDRLAAAARSHSQRMSKLRFFSHQDPEWGDLASRLRKFRISWTQCAENIFQGRGLKQPAKESVTAWMHSTAHRQN